MVKISGTVFLVVGLAVAILSFAIDKQRFFLFLVLGVIFAFIGVFKVFTAKSRKRGTVPSPAQTPKHPMHQRSHTSPYVAFCPSCGNAVRSTDHFCNKCGLQLRS